MRVFYGFDHLPVLRNPVVTVGSYDGVHAGHRRLLERIVRLAREQEGESVVVTFSPHPRTVLGNRGERVVLLNSLREKALLLEEVGIDNLIVVKFTKAFSRISSTVFVTDYLLGRIGARTLVIGYNHHFGHNQEGNFDFLRQLQQRFDFSIYEIPRQDVDRDKVSSTVIRRLIEAGEIGKANRLLGHAYFMIARADADGRVWPDDPAKLLPPPGEYPVSVEGRQGVLTIGHDGVLMLGEELRGGKEDIVISFC